MERPVKAFIASHRRTGAMRLTAKLASRFLNAYFNTGCYDFAINGEARVLRAFADLGIARPVIWDVGAHFGEYANEAHAILPDARILCFEIVPAVAAELQRNIPAGVRIFTMGLSDRIGTVNVSWNKDYHTTNAIDPFPHSGPAGSVEVVECPVSTIDDLIAQGEPAPHFLKIDVEGHESAVIRGARALLAGKEAPVMIQFEYGATWIPGGELLFALQAELERAGYRIGRVFPDHVDFKSYDWTDEHFRMGNMVAARDPEVIARLG